MIKDATDTRQKQADARRELINEQFCRLGEALNALPDYVLIAGAHFDPYLGVKLQIDADSFERLFAGSDVTIRREYGWIERDCTGGVLDGVHVYASHSRYKQQPIQPKDETITLPEVVS